MTELDADAERLLALTRQAHTPSAADKARVERLLGGALLLGATSAHAASGSAAASKLPEELDLLHDAQTKWRAGNASAALALLSEHRQRFPRSQLAQERDALAVISLCATHRTAEAKKLARRFLQVAKHSPLRTSVEESCGGK